MVKCIRSVCHQRQAHTFSKMHFNCLHNCLYGEHLTGSPLLHKTGFRQDWFWEAALRAGLDNFVFAWMTWHTYTYIFFLGMSGYVFLCLCSCAEHAIWHACIPAVCWAQGKRQCMQACCWDRGPSVILTHWKTDCEGFTVWAPHRIAPRIQTVYILPYRRRYRHTDRYTDRWDLWYRRTDRWIIKG